MKAPRAEPPRRCNENRPSSCVPQTTPSAEASGSARATRITRSRLIGDRDVGGVVPMTAPGARRGRLIPASFPQSLGQHWLRQSVGRQSSLTEKQLSNRCANTGFGRRAQKSRCFYRFNRGFQARATGHLPCICANCTDVTHAGKSAIAGSRARVFQHRRRSLPASKE